MMYAYIDKTSQLFQPYSALSTCHTLCSITMQGS